MYIKYLAFISLKGVSQKNYFENHAKIALFSWCFRINFPKICKAVASRLLPFLCKTAIILCLIRFYMGGGGGRAGTPITGIPLVNVPNSRLPNQKNEKHRHRQKCWLNITREETSNSINYMFVKSKVT